MLYFAFFAGAFIAFNELIVLPYQIAEDYWDFYEKDHGPAYMGFLHLGPSVLFFSLGCWYAIELMYDVIPDFGLMSFQHKEIGSGASRSAAVNQEGGEKLGYG